MQKQGFDLIIRKMDVSDIPLIFKIIKNALDSRDSKKAKKDLTDQSKKLYADGKIFVAEINQKVVGTIGYWRLNHHPKNVAWFDWFAVDTKYQKKGIGTALFLFMVSALKKKKYKLLCCERSSKNPLSSKFYSKYKFKKFGFIKNYWEDGGNLILLARKI